MGGVTKLYILISSRSKNLAMFFTAKARNINFCFPYTDLTIHLAINLEIH